MGQNIEMRKVTSSAINAIGYDAVAETLVIDYRKTGQYAYYGVPACWYQQAMQAIQMGTSLGMWMVNFKKSEFSGNFERLS